MDSSLADTGTVYIAFKTYWQVNPRILLSREAERIELKNVFNKKFARFKVKDIQLSMLWNYMQRGDKKGKVLEALLVSASDLKYSLRRGERIIL